MRRAAAILPIVLLAIAAGCGARPMATRRAIVRARRSPTTPRHRSTTSTAGSSTTATRSPSRRLVHELRQARRRDARGAAREGSVPGRRLPARDGRRPHRAARAGDVDGRPWRRGADDHDARAGDNDRDGVAEARCAAEGGRRRGRRGKAGGRRCSSRCPRSTTTGSRSSAGARVRGSAPSSPASTSG